MDTARAIGHGVAAGVVPGDAGLWRERRIHTDPVYMSNQKRKFRTDKFDKRKKWKFWPKNSCKLLVRNCLVYELHEFILAFL